MNVRHPMGVLHSFSIKNIFYDKMDLRLFYFHVTIYQREYISVNYDVWSRQFTSIHFEVLKTLKLLWFSGFR